mmetsp:Transcript_130394/g.417141  ORF Transcript_130394/g.417141 Transcript_130394/m.417141 type:complete len:336 (+) Transcript_130394:801-1808(+)
MKLSGTKGDKPSQIVLLAASGLYVSQDTHVLCELVHAHVEGPGQGGRRGAATVGAGGIGDTRGIGGEGRVAAEAAANLLATLVAPESHCPPSGAPRAAGLHNHRFLEGVWHFPGPAHVNHLSHLQPPEVSLLLCEVLTEGHVLRRGLVDPPLGQQQAHLRQKRARLTGLPHVLHPLVRGSFPPRIPGRCGRCHHAGSDLCLLVRLIAGPRIHDAQKALLSLPRTPICMLPILGRHHGEWINSAACAPDSQRQRRRNWSRHGRLGQGRSGRGAGNQSRRSPRGRAAAAAGAATPLQRRYPCELRHAGSERCKSAAGRAEGLGRIASGFLVVVGAGP